MRRALRRERGGRIERLGKENENEWRGTMDKAFKASASREWKEIQKVCKGTYTSTQIE